MLSAGAEAVDAARPAYTPLEGETPTGVSAATSAPRTRPAPANGTARILIVDDQKTVRRALSLLLKYRGFTVELADGVPAARQRLGESEFELVLLDLNMPGEDGDVLLAELAPTIPRTAVIVVTANADAPVAVAALKQGAYDYLCKPYENDELLEAIDRALSRRDEELRDRERFEALTGLVEERTEHLYLALDRLQDAQAAIKQVACSLAEIRDAETGAHLRRMAVYARELALALPEPFRAKHGIDEAYVNLLFEAAPLHDIGKIGIPDHVLLKGGPLSEAERELMRQHARIGEQILESALSCGGAESLPLLKLGREICVAHHEQYDGSGYPEGLVGDAIPLSARIISVADVYDALATARPYRPEALPHENVRQMIFAERGRAFDPSVVDAFLRIERRMANIARSIQDGDAAHVGNDGSPGRRGYVAMPSDIGFIA